MPLKFLVKNHYIFSTSFIVFIILNFFTACHSRIKPINIAADSLHIVLPKAGSLTINQEKKLHQACNLWYDTVLKNSNFNGGVLVAKQGNIVFEAYKGEQFIGKPGIINANTPLHIASVSKTFTAMAVLQLVQQGKINLQDDLTTFFAGFNYPNIKVKDLLSHRSGLPNYLYFMDYLGWDQTAFIGNRDVLNYLITRKAEIKNIGLPGRSFSYCNTNFVLLALIIEKIVGIDYPTYMQKTFFAPLGMNNTFVFTMADTIRMTPSYDWRGQLIPINFLDKAYGDKNIYSTPRDLLIWDRALKQNVLFNDSILQMAYTPYSNEKPGIKNYGFGWRMNLYPNGRKMIFHNGWWHGSNAAFIRLLEEDATIIVIGNRFTSAVYKAKQLANIFSSYFDDLPVSADPGVGEENAL
ncbi:MAG: serine hydrolase domain-containing protein [Ferruginibacter sp.]